MTGRGIFKRLAPFFLTLVAGVFIASIFVDITSPFGLRARRMERWRQIQQLRIENDQLRRENECMRRRLGMQTSHDFDSPDFSIPPVPPVVTDVPPPPPPRIAPRVVR